MVCSTANAFDIVCRLDREPLKGLGPISRYLRHMKLVSRASRPGLTVILCNGLTRVVLVGCPNEADSLSHYNECPRLYGILTSFW